MNNQTKIFGTDGIRGSKGSLVFDENFLVNFGKSLGSFVGSKGVKKVLVAKDSRVSGDYIEKHLSQGLIHAGINVSLLGVLPTPALACLVEQKTPSYGVMISASHNPAPDNGIKLFRPDGRKISVEDELCLEEGLQATSPFVALKKGLITDFCGAISSYAKVVQGKIKTDLSRLSVVIDCANGAASFVAPAIFKSLNIDFKVINALPTGTNINQNCGSEDCSLLQKAVRKHKATVGIAFDGDADRCVFVDENGQKISGDVILAFLAKSLKAKNLLSNDTIITTVMSGLDLDKNLKEFGITVKRCLVGDRQVSQMMLQEKASLGGENSGHIIYAPYAPTGDGILSSLLILEALAFNETSLANEASKYKHHSKTLLNIDVSYKIPLGALPRTKAVIEECENHLKNEGRVLFRYSGTEMKLRLLVESPSQKDCKNIAEKIISQFRLESASYSA